MNILADQLSRPNMILQTEWTGPPGPRAGVGGLVQAHGGPLRDEVQPSPPALRLSFPRSGNVGCRCVHDSVVDRV